jgi:hypothetical protein
VNPLRPRETATELNIRARQSYIKELIRNNKTRENFFTNRAERAVDDWYRLPLEVRKAKSINEFKKAYDKQRKERPL